MGQGPKGQKIKRLSIEDKALAWDLYFDKKESSESIAKKIGVSGVAIRMFLKRQGGVLRDAVDSHRTLPLDEHVFDVLTKTSAYWLGTLMSDGCVYDDANPKQNPRIELEWEHFDEEHVRAFGVFMGGDGLMRISKRPKKVKGGETHIYYRWDARSKHLAKILLSYGISPRKSKTANPAECLRKNHDFWRGVIDGNGHIRDENCPKVHLVGSFPILRAFSEYCTWVCPEYPFLNKNKVVRSTNCNSQINMHGAGAMALLTAMYVDSEPAMPRKKEMALHLLSKYKNTDFRILGDDIHPKKQFPYVYTKIDVAYKDFEKLQNLDAAALVKTLVKGSVTAVETAAITLSKVGVDASHFFHERVRMTAKARGHRSPIEQWDDLEIRKKIRIEEASGKHSNLRSSMIANCQPCWGFRPAIAKAVYQHLCKDVEGIKILDPCAGWGDRLTAALSMKNLDHYLGFDPNSAMFAVYERIINAYRFGKGKVHTQAFEDSTLPENHFDIAFTSPPYLDYEKYSSDPDQSYLRYPEPAMWREKFLASIPRLCSKALKVGGVLAVNISDAGVAPLVDWLVEEANKIPSLRFSGTLLMPTGNHNRANEGIYCWRKIG